jgi:hypothetical protein
MHIILNILITLALLWGVFGIAVYITRACAPEDRDFAPFKSFPIMATSGACMFFVFMVGACYLMFVINTGGTTWKEKALQERIDQLERERQFVPVTEQLYTKKP